ncbi:hypothetical protein EZV73_02335 [Acidaminobacter sp. JC074]|uniref:PucR family transcriptional regulator n=1 Tax=Acidaminobacter sp. JC074 TaxID=2530199 RepID=UPI001F0D3AD5|nr:PucR family transcriptional regulator [Acidaminobacter sp. JC074]MCH4886384.1 hypothetical protein [Acidaminobacter sp. JC074]
MSLSVLEATHIGELKKMELIAGKNGLDNTIETIGILDHEIVESVKGNFGAGDFVLTTFTAARDNESLLIKCIKDLIACDIAGLAIKKVYYTSLPKEIVDFADKMGLPIFMFDNEIYTEDIIRDLSFGIKSRSNIELMSSKIGLLYNNEYNRALVSKLALEINPYMNHEHVVFYLKDKYYVSDDFLLYVAEKYYNSGVKSTRHSLIKYNDGLILILTYKKITDRDINLDFEHILDQYDIKRDAFSIGKSQIYKNLHMLDKSIKESIYAASASELLSQPQMSYDELGIYKFLLPHIKDKWLISFTRGLLDPIISHDDGKLIETARVYIKNKGDVIKTAEELFQHKNTIRYRIKTMQQLTHIDNIYDFNEQMTIAIKFENLQ